MPCLSGGDFHIHWCSFMMPILSTSLCARMCQTPVISCIVYLVFNIVTAQLLTSTCRFLRVIIVSSFKEEANAQKKKIGIHNDLAVLLAELCQNLAGAPSNALLVDLFLRAAPRKKKTNVWARLRGQQEQLTIQVILHPFVGGKKHNLPLSNQDRSLCQAMPGCRHAPLCNARNHKHNADCCMHMLKFISTAVYRMSNDAAVGAPQHAE